MAKKSHVFSSKDRIDHSVFGTGTIVDVDPRHTTIDFDEVGTKKFMTDMVQLKSSDTLAPEKPVRKKKAKTASKPKAKAKAKATAKVKTATATPAKAKTKKVSKPK